VDYVLNNIEAIRRILAREYTVSWGSIDSDYISRVYTYLLDILNELPLSQISG
jgi:hypothetical protein